MAKLKFKPIQLIILACIDLTPTSRTHPGKEQNNRVAYHLLGVGSKLF